VHLIHLLLVLALDGGVAPAADPLQTPEVHSDRRVTLRLRAPKASEVSVAGEWTHPAPNTPQQMTRDGEGIWSITVGPLEPNIYIYVFNVDGTTITDPINPLVKLRARGAASMVEVPGGQPWELSDVPHGTVSIETHRSSVVGAWRQVFVYTPPGYDKGRQRYPVLYLLHGTNDLAAGWTMAGRANVILDNFIASKKATPMIVVMPWGHALPFGAHPPQGQPGNNDVFEDYLMREVVPLIEAKYRITPGRRNHAVVGLSMGGAQALQIGLHQRAKFGTVGVFGSGMTRADFDARFAKSAGAPFDLVYVGVGKEDGARPRAHELADALNAHGIPASYEETDGGHTYPTWRKLLVAIAPRLFRGR
jgi:enterochelin esterase-like enzyme